MPVCTLGIKQLGCVIPQRLCVHLKIKQLNAPAEVYSHISVRICTDFGKLKVHIKAERCVTRNKYNAKSHAESNRYLRVKEDISLASYRVIKLFEHSEVFRCILNRVFCLIAVLIIDIHMINSRNIAVNFALYQYTETDRKLNLLACAYLKVYLKIKDKVLKIRVSVTS